MGTFTCLDYLYVSDIACAAYSLVWFGLVWKCFDLVWFGLIWFGLIWFDFRLSLFCLIYGLNKLSLLFGSITLKVRFGLVNVNVWFVLRYRLVQLISTMFWCLIVYHK